MHRTVTENCLIPLTGLDRRDLEELASELGQPSYRGRQLYRWIYQRRETDFGRMTDLGRDLRARLNELATASLPRIISDLPASDGSRKLLFGLDDGERVESVLIPDGERRTICISTQVGCQLGCSFCATGRMGFRRNLTSTEIVGQFLALEAAAGVTLTNVVLMGMGEPLLNRWAVFKAARIITDPDGIGIPPRKFTISTAGWLPGINAMTKVLTGEPHRPPGNHSLRSQDTTPKLPRVRLAVSLNATTDEQRRRMMPRLARFSLASVVAAAERYAVTSGRPVTFGYLLLAGENDSDEDAWALTGLLRGLPCKVNLMEYNETGGQYRRTERRRAERFMSLLRGDGLTVTLRVGRGDEIAAACGQLAADYSTTIESFHI